MEKKFKGAVFFDYDGTLTDKDTGIHIPSAKTAEAIKRLGKNGYAACLATGRSLKYVPKLNIDFDLLITANGGCTIYNNKIVGEKPFSKAALKTMTDYFTAHNMIYVLENSNACYVNLPKDRLFNKMIAMFSVSPNVFTPVEEYKGESIYKILLIYRDFSQLKPMKEALNDIADITAPNAGITSCDINPKGVSKSDGIADVCRYFNIDISDTYAFGDGENDYTMIKFAGHGIAMEKHHELLTSAAEFITGPAAGDGIYEGLLHYGLIDKFSL